MVLAWHGFLAKNGQVWSGLASLWAEILGIAKACFRHEVRGGSEPLEELPLLNEIETEDKQRWQPLREQFFRKQMVSIESTLSYVYARHDVISQ